MVISQNCLRILKLSIFLNLIQYNLQVIRQIYSSSDCKYLSSATILSLSYPEQQVDTTLSQPVYTGNENLGYGFWMKYQPFSQITEITSTTSTKGGGGINSNAASSGNFIYLLQQKETQINMVVVYASISSQTSTITHNIYYSFKTSISTLSYTFDPLQYEGRWILFYMYINFQEVKTYFGFHYYLDSSTYFELKSINDLPSIVKQIRHKIGGTNSITVNQETITLTQFKGRLSNVFSEGSSNIFLDIDTFLSHCYIESSCSSIEKDLTGYNLLMVPQGFINNSTDIIEQQIYVLKGWIKLAQIEDVYQKDTVIFRLTIIKDYSNDMNIGDKQLYLKYTQNFFPELNGFTLTTYSYSFPVSGMYQTSSNDIISDTGEQFYDLFVNWHFIQFETGTNNNNGQPLFSIYSPTLTSVVKYKWPIQLYYFSGVVLYFTIGGDSFTTDYMEGYISDLTLDVYCNSPTITFATKCHYSCLTCDGPTLSNCLSCPLNSNRVQSAAQKTCTCKNSYIDLDNQPICIAASVQYPQMTEVEYELSCDKAGYNDCGTNLECSFGYFGYQNQCVQCPGYSSYSTQTNFICSNCLFYPDEFSSSFQCTQDTQTYHSDEDYAYYSVNRDNKNIDFYKAKLNKNNLYELELQIGFSTQDFCKTGFYKFSGACLTCIDGCSSCSNSYTCKTCADGYSITQQFTCIKCKGCSSCQLSESKVVCKICDKGMYLSDGVCVSCGKNCASCSSTGICYYCEDPKQYYLTFDGYNCASCNIDKCTYCYQYYILNSVTYTTLDIGFNALNLNQVDLQVGCASCQTNLYYNIVTHACENKPISISNNDGSVSSDPGNPANGGGGGSGGGGLSDDCSFGLILDVSNNTHCLISETSTTSTQIKSCSLITNCSACIENYISSNTYCMLCADGYYAHILTGQCNQCDTSCRTCVQQNTLYNDSWKWNIKPFYKYILSSDDSHSFETYATSTSEADFQLICLTCNKGQRLYNNQCITDCNEDCTVCEIINGSAVSVQCLATPYGFLKSKNKEGDCLTCPNFCAACFDRTSEEISAQNPYFLLTTSNIKFTRVCYERFDIVSADGNYFFDQLLRTVTICSQYTKCYQKTIIKYNLHCLQDDYVNNNNGQADYQLKNNYIGTFFQNSYLKDVETSGFFTYLNSKGVRYLEYEYNVIQGNAEVCTISHSPILYTTVQQNVFSIQSVKVSFIGSSPQTPLSISSDFQINNFTSITFRNFIFGTSINNYSIIQIYNLNPSITLEITDCTLTNHKTPSSFFFYSSTPYTLIINNVILQEFYLKQSQLFILIATQTLVQNRIQINNLQIINSIFDNAVFLYLDSKKYNLYLNTIISNVVILSSNFSQSQFIKTESQLTYTTGTIAINKFTVNSSYLTQSQIFFIPSALSLEIANVIVNATYFISKSYLLKSNIIRSTNFNILDSFIMDNSLLFSNDVDYTSSVEALTNSALIQLVNIEIDSSQYSTKNSIIYFINYYKTDTFTVNLSQITLIECLYTLTTMPDYISYESSLIYLECQTCIISGINIIRGYGFPEIAILNSQSVQITNMIFTLSSKYYFKTLHTSYDCVSRFAKTQMFYFLYIGQYINVSIDTLQVKDSIVFNNPFIIFQGYELMKQTLSEQISITNSIFKDNMLIISKQNRQTCVISFQTEQVCNALFDNVQFILNHLNEYFQDLTRESASTLLISLQQGTVTIQDSLFQQNIATNTTDSIMQIKSNQILISNSKFQSNNILQTSKISKKVLLSTDQFQIGLINLVNAFTISSKSGNGLLISTAISLDQVVVNNSFANYGGGFYINTQGTGILSITNSNFNNTQTSLASSSFSKGGCIYIDAQLSKLNFTLFNTKFSISYSRIEGGALYILPSQTSNQLDFSNLEIVNCFSVTKSFLSYVLSSLSTIQSYVVMENLTFSQTKAGFENFLSKIKSLSDSDIQSIQTNNPLIYIQYGNVSMKNLSLQQMHISFLFELDQPENIIIEDITIEKSTVLYSPLIRLSFRETSYSRFLLDRISIKEVTQYRDFFNGSIISAIFQPETTITCPSQYPTTNPELDDYNSDLYEENLKLLNKYYIYQDQSFNFSLIEIDNLNQSHTLFIKHIDIDSTNCSECQYGLIRVLNIQKLSQENMKFSSFAINNCVCGNNGCFALVQNESTLAIRSDIVSSSRMLQQHDYTYLSQNFTHQALIEFSQFYNNQAEYGGAIFVVDIATLVNDCKFEKNKATIGGAIYYYSSQTQIEIFDSNIIQNKATIAGGLYLNQQSLQETDALDVNILNNNSTQFGQDIFESPRSLTLSYDGGVTKLPKITYSKTNSSIVEQIVINPYKILGYTNKTQYLMYPSGRSISSYDYFDQYSSLYIPYNLSFRIIALNKYNTQEKKLLSSSTCTLSPIVLNKASGAQISGLTVSLSYTIVKFNQTSGDFNLDDLIIYFNPTYESNVVLRLKINCDMISIPKYDSQPPYLITSYITNYTLQVDIKTFPCQLGEFLNSTSGGCVLCDTNQNQYQVEWNAQSCAYKDDQKMKSISSSMIQLRSSYWRAYYYSQTIEQCYHLKENCQGGWKPGDESCIVGHIGALCEQCDLYNIRGSGSYSTSSQYSCGSCDEVIGNVLTIFFISIWTLISILMSVSSTVDMIEEFIIGLRLKAFGVTVVIKSASSAILIKVFTNYLQIISTIATFQLQVPSGLASLVNSVGNPIESMAYSLDCFLITITDILIIYFRIIWSLLMATSYIIVFFSLSALAILLKSIKFNFSYISTALIYVFIYLQPNLIGGLISLVSYRVISDQYWVQGNVAYRYDTFNHAKWLITFCFPLLLLFAAVIPTILWYGVYINKNRLDFTQTRQTWGYLYNEYKLHAYFWETIKILQKELIIIVLTYYEDYIPIKASLVFLVLFSYSFYTTKKKPYMTGDLNYLDTQSTIVCAVSIILGSSIYTAQQSDLSEIVWPFYIIIAILNALFVIKMLAKILFAYFVKLNDQIDKIKDMINSKFPFLMKQHPIIQELFESKKKQQERVKSRYNKLRLYLIPQAKKILEFKRLNKLDLPGRMITQNSESQLSQFPINSKSSHSGLNSPPVNNIQQQEKYITDLLQYPQSAKIYPERQKRDIESQISSLHQIEI